MEKNDNNNNKKDEEINSSYKTNEFETRNISEFPVNENIIKNNVEEHNNLYINKNNINVLNAKRVYSKKSKKNAKRVISI